MDTVAVPTGNPNALQGLLRLNAARQVAMLLALAGSVALGVYVALWSQTPSYVLLFGSLSGSETAAVGEGLEKAGIPFRVEQGSGAILVPSEKVHEARLKMAGQGLPKRTEMGVEMLNRKQSFGTSQFVERARYKHALEVELARSIASLDTVQSARVHLALPRETSFLRGRKKPTASVLLHLHPGRRIEAAQANAVTHLVAAAIPNLEPTEVRVLDDKGRLLTEPAAGDGLELGTRELRYVRELEAHFIQRIESILAPLVGDEAVNAQVVADVDFTRVERTHQSFDPDGRALRSEQRTEQQSTSSLAGGIPGALTNQPPPRGTAPEQAGRTAAQGATGDEVDRRLEKVENWEIPETISHVRSPGGSLRRLSVAVVVDNIREPGPDGQVAERARTPEEMARITSLVKEAIGFRMERGDSVDVVNSAFVRPEPVEPLPEPPLWEQPFVWNLAKQVGGALLVILLFFAVLRPLMRSLVAREQMERQLAEAEEKARLALEQRSEMSEDQVLLSGEGGVAALQRPGHEASVGAVRSLVADDPKRVANVIRNWVAQDG